MNVRISRWLIIFSVLFFMATYAQAQDEKVLKVYAIKSKSFDANQNNIGLRSGIDDFDIYMPNDEQMAEARKAVGNMDLRQRDLKNKKIGDGIAMEAFVLEVQKAYTDQPAGENAIVNGIAVMKPTEQELDQQRSVLKLIKEVRDIGKNFEFQLALGGAPALTPALANSYHLANTANIGLGFQFTPFFDTLLDFEINDFPPEPAIPNGGFEYTSTLIELLFKFRLTPDGMRPYLFFGPAASVSSFGGSFAYKSFTGTVDYQSLGAFAVIGGLGIEFPLSSLSHFFIQGEVVYNFVDSDTANLGSMDQPNAYLPIEIGVVFGK